MQLRFISGRQGWLNLWESIMMLSLKDCLLFYFYRSNLQVNIHSLHWHGCGFSLPVSAGLSHDFIYWLQSKNAMQWSLLTAGNAHERGVPSQREASLMKHSCRADLFDDPCYINTQALRSTLGPAGNQSSPHPLGSPWPQESKWLLFDSMSFLCCCNKLPLNWVS